jgi:hypothetical protein
MNSKNTMVWFVAAAILFAFIWILKHHFGSGTPAPANVFSALNPSEVTSVQIIPSGALEIRAYRTNSDWFLSEPVSYPAQSAAIETLLGALQKLTPAAKISAAELRTHNNPEAEFGFENPQVSLVVETGGQRRQLLVGNKTAPGDRVFLRIVGVDGMFVADTGWLKFIPRSADDWRSTALVDAGQNDFDFIVLTNGAKVPIELHRDATNHLWHMTRPLQARADNDRITDALQQLRSASAARFVTDDPKADLSTFGLQPADLDLWLGRSTNFSAAIHAGKNTTNDANQIFARREGWNAVFTTVKDALTPWHGSVNDFRDPRLLELTAPVAEIEVRGENNFTLQRDGTNGWRLAGEKFSADDASAQAFIKLLAGLRVAEFVKDVVTAPDLETYGLADPRRRIILRSAAGLPRQSETTAGDTNAVIAQLLFGTNQTDKVFVRRADEDFVYAITTNDFNRLPEAGWEFRDRRIWNFSEDDVAQITLHQNGRTRQVVHTGPNKWSLAPGSQGIINPPAIEETAHRLGELAAYAWFERNMTEPETLGWNTNNLQITVELKNGAKCTVDFIRDLPQAQTALAAVTLDSERWAFVFPPTLCQFVLNYLTIPANVP